MSKNRGSNSPAERWAVNPIDEYFEMCLDSDRKIHPGKVKYALAYAYRFGFLEGKEKHRPVIHDIPCSVPVPEPVYTEKELQQMVDRVKESMGLNGAKDLDERARKR